MLNILFYIYISICVKIIFNIQDPALFLFKCKQMCDTDNGSDVPHV